MPIALMHMGKRPCNTFPTQPPTNLRIRIDIPRVVILDELVSKRLPKDCKDQDRQNCANANRHSGHTLSLNRFWIHRHRRGLAALPTSSSLTPGFLGCAHKCSTIRRLRFGGLCRPISSQLLHYGRGESHNDTATAPNWPSFFRSKITTDITLVD